MRAKGARMAERPGAPGMASYLDLLQRQMTIRFEEIRTRFRNPTNRGTNAEEVVRQFLRQFLPPYHRIGHGQVIDTRGNASRQVDVLITNEYQPFLNDLAIPSVFIIEGIACAGEVKSELDGKRLTEALENCREFKKLHPENISRTQGLGNAEDVRRFVLWRPFFVFAFRSKLTLATIRDRVRAWDVANTVEMPAQMNAVFTLDRGGIINYGDGKGSLVLLDNRGRTMPGYRIRPREVEEPLFGFLTWLCTSIPRVPQRPLPPIVNYLIPQDHDVKHE